MWGLSMKRLSTLFWALILIMVAPVLVYGQDDDCLTIVQNALDSTNKLCSDLGRNQACYVSSLDAQLQTDTPVTLFTKAGDLVTVDSLKSLTLSPLDTKSNTWGVALMKLQANLLDSLPDWNVTLALFGDVQIESTVAEILTLDVTTKQVANLRQGPSKTAPLVTSFKADTPLVADGRSQDAAWLRVHSADLTFQGWISAPLTKGEGDLNTLAIVSTDAPPLSPMQVFHFKTGLNDAPCSAAPDSGILIQAPKGSGTINLIANSVDITLDSTAYIQAQPSGDMIVSILDGQGIVTAVDKTVIVPAGSRVHVPLDSELKANGVPTDPEPYDDTRIAALPLSLLTEATKPAPALTSEAIAAAIADIQPLSGKWAISASNAHVTPACGQGESVGTKATTFTVAKGPFDLTKMFATSSDKTLTVKTVIVKKQGNVYILDFDASIARGHYTFQVISPTLMRVDRLVASTVIKDCVATISDEIKYIGK
jgi:hypothetical protein